MTNLNLCKSFVISLGLFVLGFLSSTNIGFAQVPGNVSLNNPGQSQSHIPDGVGKHNSDVLANLPEPAKMAFDENVSPKALEMINKGILPMQRLLDAGIGSERFVGEVYALYHEMGAVYIFGGTGKVILNNQEFGVNGSFGEYIVGEAWQDDEVIGPLNGVELLVPSPCGCSAGGRYHRGFQMGGVNNQYKGAIADVTFPQYTPASFDILTSHVVFQWDDPSTPNDYEGRWFETYVGQYNWGGGGCYKPIVGTYFHEVSPSLVVFNMVESSVNSKRARIRSYNDIYSSTGTKASEMSAWDLDNGRYYDRIVYHNYPNVTDISMLKEVLTPPCYTPTNDWTYVFNTWIITPNNIPIDWTTAIGNTAEMGIGTPVELLWTNQTNREYKVRPQ